MRRRMVLVSAISIAVIKIIASPVLAGSLDAPGAPAAGSGMPTTSEIYNRLNSGAAIGTPGAFRDPAAGPSVGAAKTLAEIKGKLPLADNSRGAKTSDVLSGKTFWGLRTDGTWGIQAAGGAITAGSNVTGANGLRTITIPYGLYPGTTTATVSDSNLVSGNIRSGTSIFGVSGAAAVMNTGGGTAAAADIKTGKKAYVAGALVTGTQTGGGYICTGTLSALGRWCDNGNGTVRDMSTGLIWLKNGDCGATLGGIEKTGNWGSNDTLNWDNANMWTSLISNGTCGLSDGSLIGDWRMPTKSEFLLFAAGTEYIRPTPTGMYNFIYVMPYIYWSSSSSDATYAWIIDMYTRVFFDPGIKTGNGGYVWPVRSGQ